MKIIKILQKKQENGLWGMSLNCFKMENDRISTKNEVLHSAIVSAVNQVYNNPFEIFMLSESGFAMQIYKTLYDIEYSHMLYFKYLDYEVIDDTLYEFRNSEKEHLIFLRKQKLKQLEKI